MNKDDEIRAINEAYIEGLKHIYNAVVTGLIDGEKPRDLRERATNDHALHSEAHAIMTGIIEGTFKT